MILVSLIPDSNSGCTTNRRCTAVQRQKAISACVTSKQILPFVFAEQCRHTMYVNKKRLDSCVGYILIGCDRLGEARHARLTNRPQQSKCRKCHSNEWHLRHFECWNDDKFQAIGYIGYIWSQLSLQ